MPSPLFEIQDMVHIQWMIGGPTKQIKIVNLVFILKETSSKHYDKQLPQESRRKAPLKYLEQGHPIELVHVSDRKIIEHK